MVRSMGGPIISAKRGKAPIKCVCVCVFCFCFETGHRSVVSVQGSSKGDPLTDFANSGMWVWVVPRTDWGLRLASGDCTTVVQHTLLVL